MPRLCTKKYDPNVSPAGTTPYPGAPVKLDFINLHGLIPAWGGVAPSEEYEYYLLKRHALDPRNEVGQPRWYGTVFELIEKPTGRIVFAPSVAFIGDPPSCQE